MYSNNLQSGSPLKSYCDDFYREVGGIIDEMKFDTMVPHKVYRESLHKSDELFVLLCQMKDRYGQKGVDTTGLSNSIHLYMTFMEKEKKALGRDIAFNTEYLNKLIPDLCRSDKINSILKNDKLSDFVKEIFLYEKLFDFTTLTIQS